ncbi:MAG: hypothetical protein V3W41_15055 [Planctomycetota bacterium]
MISSKLVLFATLMLALMTAFVACSAEDIEAKKKEVEQAARDKMGKGFQSTLDKLNVNDLIGKAKEKGGAELTGLADQAQSKFGDIQGLMKQLTSGEGVMSAIGDKLKSAIPDLQTIIGKITSALGS